MNDKKKKQYVIPEAEVVDFEDEDIVTTSDNGRGEWEAGVTEGWWN